MEEIIRRIQEDAIQFLIFQFTTIDGRIRQLMHPANKLESLLTEGMGFDGSSCKYVPVNTSDLVLKPDPATYRVLPWGKPENLCARFICDVYSMDGSTPFAHDPRNILKRFIREMKAEFGSGWEFIVAPELEFFLLEKDEKGNFIPHDRATYFDMYPYDRGMEFRLDAARLLDALGVVTEKNHHEVPNGKHEINFRANDALTIADTTMTYRQAVKYLAGERGLTASFMPKPFIWTYGCGMHIHLNLKDAETGTNLFYDSSQPDFLSETARCFIGGLLSHAKGLTGMTNPSVNSYKRLVPGWEAPVYVSWGFGNRSALLRIPASAPKSIRVETRNPDSSCNPYLAFAAILACGLDGIRKQTEPPRAVNENIYEMDETIKTQKGITGLPANLKDALDALENDQVLADAFGSDFMSLYLLQKRKHEKEFATAIHPWELEQYVNI